MQGLWVALSGLTLLLAGAGASAQPVDPALFSAMRWRMIGPHRGGRTVAAVGVPGQPNLFYIGVNNGGVWRTTDAGRTWTPIFDDQPTGSIGSIAVAASDPSVIYVGTGEGLQRPDLSTGDGIYKSSDGGKSWQHLGLRDGQQIPAIVVDPRDPDRLLVAVLGHPYGPNEERGIFRSRDGGRSFEKVLYRDPDTGGIDVVLDPHNPDVVYAALWAARQAPWEIGGSFQLAGSGLFKSEDGGTTWRPLTQGLPGADDGLGRIGLGVAPSRPGRLYALVDAPKLGGLYRSEDAGESWTLANADPRLWGRGGDFAEVKVDPKDPDLIYVANVAAWKSTDGGRTFDDWRGAPGGDDYHRLWIDPDHPQTILAASDQGAIVTVNGGRTWSSWYNQPTAQFYHVSTDNQFPYWVYGGQQESGSVGIASRGNDGQITFRDWHPVGVEEYGYVAPDPLDPSIVYGGKVSRYDRRTGQVQNVAPRPLRGGDYRVVRTQPVLFSPVDPRILYFASNRLWKTVNGGRSWTEMSPDLTRQSYPIPGNLGAFAGQDPEKGKHRGVIYTVAPSPLDVNRIWVGTDDGLIHLTRDGGKTWREVTPPALTPWSKVSLMDASHFDAETAYAAINTFRLDDLRPHIYRTRDGGKTWAHITEGIPDGGVVNVVREDPVRKGLLFAGSERSVYVSFDDGEHWQSLRLNLPATSIRDLVVKGDDLVVATHGRSFWILDDMTLLRQVEERTAGTEAALFKPQIAYRVRWNNNSDTPLPPDEPAGENPPDGAVIDYWLGRPADGPVAIEIADAAGRVVRRFGSDDPVEPVEDDLNFPRSWVRPAQALSTDRGAHRLVWDLHSPPPAVLSHEYPIAAIPRNTPRLPVGPWVLPGEYRVTLSVGGQRFTQPLTVKLDPRVATPAGDLRRQFELSVALVQALDRDLAALRRVRSLRGQVEKLAARLTQGELATSVSAFSRKLAALEGVGPAASEAPGLGRLNRELAALLDVLQDADAVPTTQALAAIAEKRQALEQALARWSEFEGQDLPALNAKLATADLPPLEP